eukprot:scaffold1928_cov165-Chaetoceros_neogracile.AAC.3
MEGALGRGVANGLFQDSDSGRGLSIKPRSLVSSVLAYAMAYSNSLLTCCLIPVRKGIVTTHDGAPLDHYIGIYAVMLTSLLLN